MDFSENSAMVLGMRIDRVPLRQVCDIILRWCRKPESRYVCVANVHMCMESFDDAVFRKVVNNADLVVPDGKPIAVSSSLLGPDRVQQIRGTDLVLALCDAAHRENINIGLYGSTQNVVVAFKQFITSNYPCIRVGCAISPPFRALTKQEDKNFTSLINRSGIQILFVGLGCPKQELWMAEHNGRINAVMLGVGAAFDFLSGSKREAPRWMQNVGIEWLYRVSSEPKIPSGFLPYLST